MACGQGRDLFGKLATVEAGLAEAQFTERGLWIDRCWRKAAGAGVLRDRNDLKLLTGCTDDIPNSFAHQEPCHW